MKVRDVIDTVARNHPEFDLVMHNDSPWNPPLSMNDWKIRYADVLDSEVLVYTKHHIWIVIEYGVTAPDKTLKMALIVHLYAKEG